MIATNFSSLRVCRQSCGNSRLKAQRAGDERRPNANSIEKVWVVDQDLLALCVYGSVGGIPIRAQSLGDAGHGQVFIDGTNQFPLHFVTGGLRSCLGGSRRILPPYVPAFKAPEAAHPNRKHRRPPPERCIHKISHDRILRPPLLPAYVAAIVHGHHPAEKSRPTRLELLTDHRQSELVEASERSDIRGKKDTVQHVSPAVDRSGLRHPDLHAGPSPRIVQTNPGYTLDSEEPLNFCALPIRKSSGRQRANI